MDSNDSNFTKRELSQKLFDKIQWASLGRIGLNLNQDEVSLKLFPLLIIISYKLYYIFRSNF